MAYKYVNDNGLKAYTKKVKGALKDLHTPIAISVENTTESMAQNVKNIADFIAKAKAAGIANVNGMAVTCLIDNAYSGVGYILMNGNNFTSISGAKSIDDVNELDIFLIDSEGNYDENYVLHSRSTKDVTSNMLDEGARKPIILTPETTEVDEETYQKLLSDDVDVVFKTDDGTICTFIHKKDNDDSFIFSFTGISGESVIPGDIFIYSYDVVIVKNDVHKCTIETNVGGYSLDGILTQAGYFTKDTLSPVLQEIYLTGTDAEIKARLAQFETDWKDLTGASDMAGARFVGKVEGPDRMTMTGVFSYADGNIYTGLVCTRGYTPYEIEVSPVFGSLEWVPLFSHLEAVNIIAIDDAASKKKNLERLNNYKANLRDLGVNLLASFQIPFRIGNTRTGTFSYRDLGTVQRYVGVSYALDTGKVFRSEIDTTGKYIETPLAFNEDVEQVKTLAQAVKAFGAIELKASDNAANKAALTAYLKILTDAEVTTTNGYSVPVRITGNSQEYHGMLNIGTGALLSGIVTDVNENHHYPFNVSTADGVITFDANNYFLEKTSNEVTEMLDAIKYSYTPVPLTATTLSNKAQLEVFLSKVPNAQVMHCTYKDVYAGTLHKINGEWFGLLVKNTNNYEDALQVKLQADGTLIEGTTSLAQVNSKLDTIIG